MGGVGGIAGVVVGGGRCFCGDLPSEVVVWGGGAWEFSGFGVLFG